MSLRDGQLLAFGRDVIGIRRKPEIPVGAAVALGVVFNRNMYVLCLGHGVYIYVCVFFSFQ